MLKILAISGSIRIGSVNELIIRYLSAINQIQAEIRLFKDLREIPIFEPGLPEQDIPAGVFNFLLGISQADAVIICTPEYVFSMPGVLKNALEWAVSTTVFSGKPVGVIVAAARGEQTIQSLTLVMETLGAVIPAAAKVLIQGPRSMINEAGEIIDPEIIKLLQSFSDALIQTTLNSQGS